MSLIKRADVKNYYSARQGKGLHLIHQMHKPVTARSSAVDVVIETDVSVFVDDFSMEHSSAGGAVSAVVIDTTKRS